MSQTADDLRAEIQKLTADKVESVSTDRRNSLGESSLSEAIQVRRKHLLNPLESDLDQILAYTSTCVWEELRGARLFITGGTGFLGRWILESFTWANDRLSLGASAVVLTRDAKGFAAKAPHLAFRGDLEFHYGDVR